MDFMQSLVIVVIGSGAKT
ncbi:Protein of unknown function [Bacillus mycoides]|uniref:Uncharacterized protein n=1 Tax=Bacillus mycoides TaxID=1405 RepID=A0A1G4EMA0_BACMY|nr:Protein of unknown function [Bacillus mycoides]